MSQDLNLFPEPKCMVKVKNTAGHCCVTSFMVDPEEHQNSIDSPDQVSFLQFFWKPFVLIRVVQFKSSTKLANAVNI